MTDRDPGQEGNGSRPGGAGPPPAPSGSESLDAALGYLVKHRGVAVLEDVALLQSSLADLVPEAALRRAVVDAVRAGVVHALRDLPRSNGGTASAADLEELTARFARDQPDAVAVAALARALGVRTAVPVTDEGSARPTPTPDEIRAGIASGDIRPDDVVPAPVAISARRRLIALVVAGVALALVAGVAVGFALRGSGSSTARDTLPAATGAAPSTVSPSPAATPSPSPKPTPNASATPTDPKGSFAAEVKVLRTYLPADFRASCTSRKSTNPVLNRGLTARLGCNLKGDAPNLVRYYRYQDTAAMKKAFGEWQHETKASSCKSSRGRSTYTITKADGKRSGGTLTCLRLKGKLTFVWTHDRLHIVAVATDADMSWPAMKAWWTTKAGPYD